MKKNVIIIALTLVSCLFSGIANAQKTDLAPDQNPRYMESQKKYASMADTLNNLHGTTIQSTYKAYDWYEDKMERRRQNREWRHQEYLSGYYNYSPSWGYYNNYTPYPFINYSYGFGNRWGGYWGGRSRIGIGYSW